MSNHRDELAARDKMHESELEERLNEVCFALNGPISTRLVELRFMFIHSACALTSLPFNNVRPPLNSTQTRSDCLLPTPQLPPDSRYQNTDGVIFPQVNMTFRNNVDFLPHFGPFKQIRSIYQCYNAT